MRGAQIQPWLGEVADIPDLHVITSSSYTVKATDFGKTLIFNSSAAQTVTIPNFGPGFNFNALRIGAGEVTLSPASGLTISGSANLARYINTPVVNYNSTTILAGVTGRPITKMVTFTEDATSTLHTGTVPIPALSWLHSIKVVNEVLWGATSASLDVGDTADPNGYFAAVNCKANDLLVGELLDSSQSTLWGGKEGAYLVAASGRRGPTSVNFGMYYKAGSDIIGAMTVGTPGSTAGRTHMIVTYSVGEMIAAVSS